MRIFAGDRPRIVGVLTAIGVEQGVLYCRYRHQVGEANTSMAGFRQWKHALRQQPRVSPLHGTRRGRRDRVLSGGEHPTPTGGHRGDLRATGAAVGAVRIGQLRAPRSTSAASAIGRSAG